MMGKDANYVPGWDCHGLPIEWKIEEKYRKKGKNKDDVPVVDFRRECREFAAHWIKVQSEEFQRLGVTGDWDNPYTTMAYGAEAAIVRELSKFVMDGSLYRGAKPVLWSVVEKTALADAEVEYADHTSTTIWVRFPVASTPVVALEGTSVVIWTTTPWTIPANQAVAFNPDVEYGLYRVDAVMSEEELGFAPYAQPGETLILADALAESVFTAAKVSAHSRIGDVASEALKDMVCRHPLGGTGKFFTHEIPLIPGDHVTDDAGTGFVHSAPAHGEEDFHVWVENGHTARDIRQIVDADGCYTDEVPERFRGLGIIRTTGKKRGQPGKANDEVIKALAESGNLLARGVTMIRDAHSWRSKAPVIRRATPQWFIAMDKPIEAQGGASLRELALKGIDETAFTPETGRTRLRSMVETRPDWLISRQRNWGVPITIFVNEKGEPHTAALPGEQAEAVNARILEAIRQGGVEAWFSTPKEDLLGEAVSAGEWDKVTDVLDVWFDSGTTHAFALRARGVIDEETGQADVYMEGSDQHRGWFQSSLLESCATRGLAPYKSVVTHGFIVDAEGRKMSKSIGNTMEPAEIQKQYGIEILRIWTASSDFTEDLRISKEILKGTVESYRRLRNTLRYLLGALKGYTPQAEQLPAEAMPGLERWMLHRLGELDTLVRESYRSHDYKRVMATLVNFCAVDLSAIYFDIRKDSLYCDPVAETAAHWDSDTERFGNRRRAVRTVMDAILERLLAWLAPVMAFTAEEAFLESRFRTRESVHLMQFPDGDHSIHLERFRATPPAWRDDALAAKWARVRDIRRVVTGALEIQRRDKTIGASLEAAPDVHVTDQRLIDAFEGEDPAEIFITSGGQLIHGDVPGGGFTLDEIEGVGVVFQHASGVKCARSWKYFDPGTALERYPAITPRDGLAVRALDAARDA